MRAIIISLIVFAAAAANADPRQSTTWANSILVSPQVTPGTGDVLGFVHNGLSAQVPMSSTMALCPPLAPGNYSCANITIGSNGCMTAIVGNPSCGGGGGGGTMLLGGDASSCILVGGDSASCLLVN